MIDGTYTLILKFSEQYFWEPGQKVFDVAVGDVNVIKNLDPFARAGSKLLPYDAFIVLQARRGELFFNTEKVKNAVKKDALNVHFKVGTADNPKVNAIALIKGGLENTHKENFDLFQQTLIAIQEEKAMQKAKEESLFNEDSYDFEERIDGRGPLNHFMSYPFLLEGVMIAFIIIFVRVLPNKKK
jgi:hypothetical protein